MLSAFMDMKNDGGCEEYDFSEQMSAEPALFGILVTGVWF
jgi:hypothetical protein